MRSSYPDPLGKSRPTEEPYPLVGNQISTQSSSHVISKIKKFFLNIVFICIYNKPWHTKKDDLWVHVDKLLIVIPTTSLSTFGLR